MCDSTAPITEAEVIRVKPEASVEAELEHVHCR